MCAQLLLDLAEAAGLKGKMDSMFEGEHINVTEDRPVLHTALRARRTDTVMVDGKNVVNDVWKVRPPLHLANFFGLDSCHTVCSA